MRKEYFPVTASLQTQNNKELMKKLGINETNAGAILHNKKICNIAVTALASIFSAQTAFAEGNVDGAMAKVDTAGGIILKIVRKVGYWICIIMCIVEIFRCMANGDLKSIGRIIAKYALAYGTTYLITWLFDIIANCFS